MRTTSTALAVTLLAAAGCQQETSGDALGAGGDDGDDGAGGDDGADDGGTDGGTGSGDDGGTGGGSDDGTDGSDAKFDVGGMPDVGGDDGTGDVEFDCDNIDMFTATSIGCVFWSTNWRADPGYGLGIGIGNPSSSMATVTIEHMSGGAPTVLTTETLDPNESKIVNINGPGGLLPGVNVDVEPGLNTDAAFRVESDVPIGAMQISPLGGGPSHVSEASLLLPENALDTSHFAVGRTDISPGQGRVAVVATEVGTTLDTTGGPATLDAFDVQVYSTDDATGFFVGSDAPVAVFSGTECSFIPDGVYACDHLEEQVVPAASWGTKYVGGRHPVRLTSSNDAPEDVYWRVVAGVPNTTVTLTPAVAGAQINLADAGDFQEFTTTESFVAESSDPFMLVQYMSGCRNVTPVPINPNNPCNEPATGDPYMIQMPPVDQWLDALPFLTDTSYPRDFVVFMREQGTTIDLDCLGAVDAGHFTAIPGTSYEVGSVDLDAPGGGEGTCVDGEQFVSSSHPIGVIVGGMDWATSYGYAGGLSFTRIWEPPTEPPG